MKTHLLEQRPQADYFEKRKVGKSKQRASSSKNVNTPYLYALPHS